MFISTVLYERLQELLASLMVVVGLMQTPTMPIIAPIKAETPKVEVIMVQEVKTPIIKELPPKKEVIKPKEVYVVKPIEKNTDYGAIYSVAPQLGGQSSQPIQYNANQNVGVTLPELPVVELSKLDTPKMEAELRIFNPIPGKGIETRVDPIKGGEVGYRVSPDYPSLRDESNYLELGLYVKNPDGSDNKDTTVEITATDSSQNKTIIGGTGNQGKIFENGNVKTVFYYHFHYEFKTAGTHTITFNALGKSVSVSVEVTEGNY